jgi:ABC-type sugar transport system ATPase subunit
MESASDSLASSRLMASPSEVFEGEIVALIGENGAGNRRP